MPPSGTSPAHPAGVCAPGGGLCGRPPPAECASRWYLLDGDRFPVNLDGGRTRLSHLRNDPRVSLTVLDADSWYTHVSVQGRVVELVDDEDLADIDCISRHYTGNPYPARDRGRVSAWIEVDRWHGWGAARNT